MTPSVRTLATAAAIALLTTASSTSASECNTLTIAAFLVDTNVVKCSAATGLAPLSPPSSDVLAKVCSNSACQSMIASLKKLGLGDCTVGGVALETAFLKPIDVYCAATTPTTAPTPGSSTPASAAHSPTWSHAALAGTAAAIALTATIA